MNQNNRHAKRYKIILYGEIAVVVLLVLGLLFKIDLNVRRGPLLLKLSGNTRVPASTSSAELDPQLEAAVLPADGVRLPIKWGTTGQQMVEAGVIDRAKFEALYEGRGGLSDEMQALLDGEGVESVRMTGENSAVLLNLLWAFGLSNQSRVLDEGPMVDPKYNGAGGFASTGGWTLAKGQGMDHYSRYQFVKLTGEQQELVVRVSQNIYRPCCGNSTYFPDCNHGMAMLGLLELMAANGVSEPEMYQTALVVNSFWFPDTYLTAAKYYETKGKKWVDVDPKEVLSADISSARGYQQIRSQVQPPNSGGGGGCGV